MSAGTGTTLGFGSDYIDTATSDSTGGFVINATNTGISYYHTDGDDVGTNPYEGSARTHVIRKIKKKRGSKVGTDRQSDRIRVSPMVIFRFLKRKFTVLEADRLYKRLEQISGVLETVPREQIALVENIEKKAMRVMREATMASCGFNKFIEGDILDKFVAACKNRVIKVTKIKNYTRFIPKKVISKMNKAEEKGLFDGYVVAHTDPNDTSVQKTEEEKKDPILFGVIAESDRFYFIADWKDKLCDLTLNMIIDKLGLDKTDYKMDNNFEKVFLEALEIDDE